MELNTGTVQKLLKWTLVQHKAYDVNNCTAQKLLKWTLVEHKSKSWYCTKGIKVNTGTG